MRAPLLVVPPGAGRSVDRVRIYLTTPEILRNQADFDKKLRLNQEIFGGPALFFGCLGLILDQFDRARPFSTKRTKQKKLHQLSQTACALLPNHRRSAATHRAAKVARPEAQPCQSRANDLSLIFGCAKSHHTCLLYTSRCV